MQSDWLFILDEKCAIENFNVYFGGSSEKFILTIFMLCKLIEYYLVLKSVI